MYQVVIVDDEPLIRNGLAEYTPWSDYEMQVAHVAVDAKDALQYIENHPIDVLITDIRMPHRTGLELVEDILNIGQEPQVILISGYNDFIFTKRAIQLKIVCDYILKPIDEEELRHALKSAYDNLKSETPFSLSNDESGDTLSQLNAFVNESSSYSSPILSCIDLLYQNYTQPNLTLNQVADDLGFSPNYLSVRFKEEVGIGFNKYLLNLRIAKAKQLLSNARYRIYEIAYMVGIHDEKYFSRIFKRETSLTPAEYRQKCQHDQIKSPNILSHLFP